MSVDTLERRVRLREAKAAARARVAEAQASQALRAERARAKATGTRLAGLLAAQPAPVLVAGTRRLSGAWRSLARRIEAQRLGVGDE